MKPFFQRQPLRLYQPIQIPSVYFNNENMKPSPQYSPNQFQTIQPQPQRQLSAPNAQPIPIQKQQFTVQRIAPTPPLSSSKVKKPLLSAENKIKPVSVESIIFNESKITDIHEQQLNELKRQIVLKDTLIKQQGEKILSITNQLNNVREQVTKKIIEVEEAQNTNFNSFRQFKEEIQQNINNLEMNTNYDGQVKAFLHELDKRALNLQNHIGDNIKLIKDLLDHQLYKTQHLCTNVAANISYRLTEDENYFKGELDILRNQLKEKVDINQAKEEIQTHIQKFRLDVQAINQNIISQIQHYKQSEQDQANTLIDELKKKLVHIEQFIQNQFSIYEDKINQMQDSANLEKQHKKSIQQQLSILKSKFSQIQMQFGQIQTNHKKKLQELLSQNLKTQKDLQTQLSENSFLKSQICLLEQQINQMKMLSDQRSKTEKITARKKEEMLSPVQTKSINKSYLSGASLSTKAEKIPNKNGERLEIGFEEFADFNDNSISESAECSDSNSEFFYPNQTNPFNKVYQQDGSPNSSKKQSVNTLKSASLKSKLQSDALKLPVSQKDRKKKVQSIDSHFQKLKGQQQSQYSWRGDSKINETIKAINRRMLFNNQTKPPLECCYHQNGQLTDIETGLEILNEAGDPISVTQAEKKQLVQDGIIKLI